jgi:hypothetical protein
LSQRLFDFWREWHAQATACGTAHGNSSLADPAVEPIRRDSETCRNFFDTELAGSEQLWPVDVIGVTDPLN